MHPPIHSRLKFQPIDHGTRCGTGALAINGGPPRVVYASNNNTDRQFGPISSVLTRVSLGASKYYIILIVHEHAIVFGPRDSAAKAHLSSD